MRLKGIDEVETKMLRCVFPQCKPAHKQRRNKAHKQVKLLSLNFSLTSLNFSLTSQKILLKKKLFKKDFLEE